MKKITFQLSMDNWNATSKFTGKRNKMMLRLCFAQWTIFQTKSRDAISIAFVDLDIDERNMNVSFPSSDFVGGKKHLVAEQKTDDKTYTLDSVKEIQECNVHTSYIIKTGLRQVKFSNKIFYCDLIFMFSLKCQQQCLSELIWLLQEKTFFFRCEMVWVYIS